MSGLEGSGHSGSSEEASSQEESRTPQEQTDTATLRSNDSSSTFEADRPRLNNNAADEREIKIPIIGYEVVEERAKFTVFKLRIESVETNDCWFVFRRYTDFVRLHSKLKTDFPNIQLPMPKKKWFGDNFNSNFLDERIIGLQDFINDILKEKSLISNSYVRDFFCLDEPPSVTENVEESKAVVEALEEKVFHLQRQLKEKEIAYERLKAAHSVEIAAKLRLAGFVQECTVQCQSCAERLSQLGQVP